MPQKTETGSYIEVLGSAMHYFEQGEGDPILFLHTLPASGYTWRNLMPFLAPLGHCIALDLIGVGQSAKPDIAYTLEEHIHYVEQFIAAKKLKRLTLVMHGWGSLIGFDYAMRYPDTCKGLVFYEAFLQPLQGEYLSLPYQEQRAQIERYRTASVQPPTEALVDQLLVETMLQKLPPEQFKHYHEAVIEQTGGTTHLTKAIQQYWQELPSGEGNSKVDQRIAAYAQKLSESPLPKLLLYSMPGFITTMATVVWAKQHLPHLEVGYLGEELHFAQESNPQLMAELISAWLQAVEQALTTL